MLSETVLEELTGPPQSISSNLRSVFVPLNRSCSTGCKCQNVGRYIVWRTVITNLARCPAEILTVKSPLTGSISDSSSWISRCRFPSKVNWVNPRSKIRLKNRWISCRPPICLSEVRRLNVSSRTTPRSKKAFVDDDAKARGYRNIRRGFKRDANSGYRGSLRPLPTSQPPSYKFSIGEQMLNYV